MPKIALFAAISLAWAGQPATAGPREDARALVLRADLPPISDQPLADVMALAREMERFAGRQRRFMGTAEGRSFAVQMQRTVNYAAIRKTLETCVRKRSEAEAPRQLHVRVMNAALQVSEIEVDCRREGFAFNAIRDWATHGQRIVEQAANQPDYASAAALQESVYAQSMQNALDTYLNLRWQYRQTNDSENAEDVVNDALDQLCPERMVQTACPSEVRSTLRDRGVRYLAGLRGSGGTRYSDAAAATEVNTRIDELNRKLATIPIGVNRGWFNNWAHDSSDPNFEDSQESYQAYSDAYMRATMNGPGTLLHTEHMRDRAGGLRATEARDTNEISDRRRNSTRYEFKPHAHVSAADVRKARAEAEKAITDQAVRMNRLMWDKQSAEAFARRHGTEPAVGGRESAIRKLVMTNPAAVGQILMRDPSQSGNVCRAINQVNREDETDAMWKKGFMWGGIIVGGAAIVLTGGALAAGVLAAKGVVALSAGTLATMGTVATTAGAVGTAIGAAETTFWGTEIVSLRGEIRELTGGVLSGNSDPRAAADVRRATGELREAVVAFGLSAGGTALDVAFAAGFLRVASKTSRMGNRMAPAADRAADLAADARGLKGLAANPAFQRVFNRFKGKLTSEELGVLAGHMNGLDEALLARVLRRLEGMTPAKLKQTLNEGSEALAKLCA